MWTREEHAKLHKESNPSTWSNQGPKSCKVATPTKLPAQQFLWLIPMIAKIRSNNVCLLVCVWVLLLESGLTGIRVLLQMIWNAPSCFTSSCLLSLPNTPRTGHHPNQKSNHSKNTCKKIEGRYLIWKAQHCTLVPVSLWRTSWHFGGDNWQWWSLTEIN